MRIKRDYSYAFYGRRRRGSRIPMILLTGIGIILFLVFISLRFNELQASALSAVGMPVKPTPFPSELATEGARQFMNGDLDEARLSFEQALAMQPNNLDYLYEYGRVLIELEQTTQAAGIGERMVSINANDVRGYAIKANALKWSSPNDAIIAANQGEDLNPSFAPLHAAMAVAYTQIQRYTEAITRGERAISLAPNDPDSYRAYSWPLILVGQYPLAIENLEKAISLNPNLPGPYFQLAFEYKSRAQQPAMAIAIYQHIIDNMDPSPADEAKANLRICETLAGVDRAEFDLAEPYCRRAIEIDPGYGSAYRELGRMRYNRRNYEGAIDSFETCKQLQTEGVTAQPGQDGFPRVDIECWALQGLAHYWMAECDEAWTILNQALEIGLAQGTDQNILDTINIGLGNVRVRCVGYNNLPTPTAIPTRAPQPTPIGGL